MCSCGLAIVMGDTQILKTIRYRSILCIYRLYRLNSIRYIKTTPLFITVKIEHNDEINNMINKTVNDSN